MSTISVGREIAKTIISKGRMVSGAVFTAKFMVIPKETTRGSFVVSKKVAQTAVERNRLKRRGRYVFAKESPSLPKGTVVMFFAKNSANKVVFENLKKDILSITDRIKNIL